MDIVEKANEEYLDLWTEFRNRNKLPAHVDAPRYRWPILYGRLERNRILFIGFSPSWNPKWAVNTGIDDLIALYQWERSDPQRPKMEKIVRRERMARDQYPYFQPMKGISEEVGHGWEHIDLFAVRERAQYVVMEMLKVDYSGSILEGKESFAGRQLGIALGLMSSLEPVCVVVANTLASRTLRKHWKTGDDWTDDETFRQKGYHEIELNGRRVPVFFSSMLSGQRALDRGSRERLSWHIKMSVQTTH